MALDGAVPRDRPGLATTDFRVGAPVRAQTWYDVARLAHWVSGRGQVVIPTHRVGMVLDNVSETLRYYTPGSGRAMYRAWLLRLRSVSDATGATGTISINGGGTISYYVEDDGRYIYAPRVIIEEVTPDDTEAEATFEITSDTTYGVATRVESLGCFEVPRVALERTAADCGISLDSIFARRPIFNDGNSPPESSLASIVQSVHEMTVATPLRRIGHIGQWGYPLVTASAGPVDLHLAPYRLVPRKDRVGATTQTLRARVYGFQAAGTGEWRVVTTSGGASSWVTLPTSAAWSDEIDFDMNCEDQSTTDGQPSGGYDDVTFQVQSDGANDVTIYGRSCYEVA